MTKPKSVIDEDLRRYALNNMRGVLNRMKTTELEDRMGSRRESLQQAAWWATVAEALRPRQERTAE